LERSRGRPSRRFCWMARASASSKSAAQAQIRTAPDLTLLINTSETSWLFPSRSPKCCVTWRENDPCVPPRLSSRVHKSLLLLVLRFGIALTLQYLLVTFHSGSIFSLPH